VKKQKLKLGVYYTVFVSVGHEGAGRVDPKVEIKFFESEEEMRKEVDSHFKPACDYILNCGVVGNPWTPISLHADCQFLE